MSKAVGPPPPGGDYDRAGQVYAFTWILAIVSLVSVVGRMYSRIKLTRNVWWDDWCICFAMVLDFVISIMWSIYAGRGYARHLYYLAPNQLTNALELNTISRSLCMLSIGIGKISVAFLIERIAPPGNWRKWMLRGLSISMVVSAIITFIFFYAQCQPVRATWDKGMLKNGTGTCWNPIRVNTWNLVIASYWAFLDFALAFIPVDIVWKLQMKKSKKFLLSLLLSMGVFAGICAVFKTSKVPITVKARTDITWKTIELLMWNGIEMNVIIIAACIPTLRPVCLVIFKRPGGDAYSHSVNKHKSSSYHKTQDSTDSSHSRSRTSNMVFGGQAAGSPNGSAKPIFLRHDSIVVATDFSVVSRSGVNGDIEEGEWGHAKGSGTPMSELGRAGD